MALWPAIAVGQAGDTSGVLTLGECLEILATRHPLRTQAGLIREAAEDHARSSYMAYTPRLALQANASYQSDVPRVELPASLTGMGITIPRARKDQYSISMQVTQTIWDGGYAKHQAELVQAQSRAAIAGVEERISDIGAQVESIYFGLLLCDAQLESQDSLLVELDRQESRVRRLQENGLASSLDRNSIEVAKAQATQGRIEIVSERRALQDALAALLEIPTAGRRLAMPMASAGDTAGVSKRLVAAQSQVLLATKQEEQVKVALYPQIYLSAQGGYANPGLNPLADKFDWFYLAAVNVRWDFGSLYDYAERKRMGKLNRQAYELAYETTRRGVEAERARAKAKIEAMRELLEQDETIIRNRAQFSRTTQTRQEEGTATTDEVLTALTNLNEAIRQKSIHRIRLAQAEWSLQRIDN